MAQVTEGSQRTSKDLYVFVFKRIPLKADITHIPRALESVLIFASLTSLSFLCPIQQQS